MEFEFRHVHIDMLAIPMDKKKGALTHTEIQLAEHFGSMGAVDHGVVLALKKNHRKSIGRFQVVEGFDIVRAAKRAGLDSVPCLIGEDFSPAFIDLLKPLADINNNESEPQASTEETIQSAIDQFNQLKGLKLSFRKAERIGQLGKKSTLYDQKRLAENLDRRIQLMVQNRQLSKSAARSISYLPLSQQYDFALKAINNAWSVREINLARSSEPDSPVDTVLKKELQSLSTALSESIGYTVIIVPKSRLTGELIIEFYSVIELTSLLEKLSLMTMEFHYHIRGHHQSVPCAPANTSISKLILQYNNLDLIDEIKRVCSLND